MEIIKKAINLLTKNYLVFNLVKYWLVTTKKCNRILFIINGMVTLQYNLINYTDKTYCENHNT